MVKHELMLPGRGCFDNPMHTFCSTAASLFTMYTIGCKHQIRTYLSDTHPYAMQVMEKMYKEDFETAITAQFIVAAKMLLTENPDLLTTLCSEYEEKGFDHSVLGLRLMAIFAEQTESSDILDALHRIVLPDFGNEKGIHREIAFIFSARILSEYGSEEVGWDMVEAFDKNLLPKEGFRSREALKALTMACGLMLANSAIQNQVVEELCQAVEEYTLDICNQLPAIGLLWTLMSGSYVEMVRSMPGPSTGLPLDPLAPKTLH